MKQAKHILVFIIGTWLLALSPAYASDKWQHYLGFSLAGGEANILPMRTSASVKPLAGGEGEASFLYEARTNSIFIQLGAGAGYSFTRLRMSNLVEEREATDITGESLMYQYRYTSLTEQQRIISPQIMAQIGFLPTENLYLALGVKALVPVTFNYSSNANMFTAGSYERWAAEYIENRPDYGYYPESEYTHSGTFSSLKAYIAPTLEIGGNWNLQRTTLRCGLFADYGFRIGDKLANPITDYSDVDVTPSSQTQQDLSDNLRINSILDSQHMAEFSHLTVGLRLTVLFNATTLKVPCHCAP